MTRNGHIFLTGFMGSGKTSVGRELAELLRLPFVDLDERIEQTQQSSISLIFAERGEPYFRKIENEMLQAVVSQPRQVIALGGGTIMEEENRRLVADSGDCFWLKVPLPVAWHRCRDSGRPLAANKEQFERLFVMREQSYGQIQHAVEVDNRTPREIALEIFRVLRGES